MMMMLRNWGQFFGFFISSWTDVLIFLLIFYWSLATPLVACYESPFSSPTLSLFPFWISDWGECGWFGLNGCGSVIFIVSSFFAWQLKGHERYHVKNKSKNYVLMNIIDIFLMTIHSLSSYLPIAAIIVFLIIKTTKQFLHFSSIQFVALVHIHSHHSYFSSFNDFSSLSLPIHSFPIQRIYILVKRWWSTNSYGVVWEGEQRKWDGKRERERKIGMNGDVRKLT